MWLFGRLKNKNNNGQKRESLNSGNHKVISYYTASRRQIDKFERTSGTDLNQIKRHRKLLKLASNWFTILVFIVFIISGSYLLTLSQQPLIDIQGQQYRTLDEYHNLISPILKNDIRNRFKPLLRTNIIRDSILNNVPEIENVSINTSLLGHRPKINVNTAQAMAIFVQTSGENLILSKRGKLLLPLSKSNANRTQLAMVQNLTTIAGKQGMQFMRPDEANALEMLINQYKGPDGSTITNFTLSTIPHEIITTEPGRGYFVKYLLNEDIKLQYGALRATEAKLLQIGHKPNSYIDVRLADKVYYN